MKRLKKIIDWLSLRSSPVQKSLELLSVNEHDDFDSVVTNSYNAFKSENDSEGKRDWSHTNTAIEINRLNRNAFEHHFYLAAFRYQFSQLKLEIATIADKAKSATFNDQRIEAQENFKIAMSYFEDARKRFIVTAPSKFIEESKIMVDSMKEKNLTAETVSDIQNYFSLEWSQRRDIRYKSVINHLLGIEKKLRDDLVKLGIFERKDEQQSDQGKSTERKPHLNF
ncbi:hypothetical protein V4100_001006 [Pseudomonas aeruginosa]